ncbi:MAG: hypothetical protein ROZ64_04890 [Burkholderiaceae bacterium]|jgi:hypothetical protein|nr:hypothetical protein [Burkholderiaceae bacterium]
MGEIDRAVLDRWKAVNRAWLLAESGASSRSANADDPPEPHCRRSKDRFLSQVRQRVFLLLREAGLPDGNALHRLEHVFDSHVSFIARHPDTPRRILGWTLQCADARLRRRVRKVVLHYEFRLSRLIARGQRQGCIRADIEAPVATALFVAMLQNLVLRLPDDRVPEKTLLREAERVFSGYRELLRPVAVPAQGFD